MRQNCDILIKYLYGVACNSCFVREIYGSCCCEGCFVREDMGGRLFVRIALYTRLGDAVVNWKGCLYVRSVVDVVVKAILFAGVKVGCCCCKDCSVTETQSECCCL